jgi:hypothetical protein
MPGAQFLRPARRLREIAETRQTARSEVADELDRRAGQLEKREYPSSGANG